MRSQPEWPFDVDLTVLDTASITNILSDIEAHLPLMEDEGDLGELMRVRQLFEDELKAARRLH